MLDGLFDTWERHRHLFRAMLEARGHSPAVREIWDEARESFVESVAAMIRTERAAGTAPDGIDADRAGDGAAGDQRPAVGAADVRRTPESRNNSSTVRRRSGWAPIYGITTGDDAERERA